MTSDFHQETLDHDEVFHAFMNKMFPDWRTWDAHRQRMAAKRWNFTRLYGAGRSLSKADLDRVENLDEIRNMLDQWSKR